MLLGELEPDDGELALDQKDVIAHVAQESPQGSGSAVDYVMDGDPELRTVQAAIAKSDGDDNPDLHLLYERMEAIDGFTAESRASRLLHGSRLRGGRVCEARERILRRLAHAAQPGPRADESLGHPVARRAYESSRSSGDPVAGALA